MLNVLHVTGGMTRGGVETWLMHLLRHGDPEVHMDFLVHTDREAAYDEEIRSHGSRILSSPRVANPLVYARDLRRILAREGPFDVVHSHVHYYSGVVLTVAARAGVRGRIAHSHVAPSQRETARSPVRAAYEVTMRRLIWRSATAALANSVVSAVDLYGAKWEDDARFSILPYGFDFSRYAALPSREEAKESAGIPPDAPVVGHVGRFYPQKNHPFLIRTFTKLAAERPDVRLLLVGGRGNLEEVEGQIRALGLADRCHVVGEQADVGAYVGAMDVMVFPSLYEGLGIVVLEAQAAGVPVLASEAVPPEADVIPGLVTRMPLERGEDAWASAVTELMARPRRSPKECTAAMERSPYGIETCLRDLRKVYAASLVAPRR
ncbi:MAG TPA: glycosyltransferase [Actinomycetota bacterium]|nr:glycosyltransferase [Actinomycetota bacterium]